ncbi:hypothetical protein LMH87_001918 [Akanthomyces muscarius]|uniref:Uncharacterized protein n=1 Tax=Akanthomyces muscarius TaxID=2231603 RepID=A0A9W8UIQ5_AKAMU|nr:hypothetical protein LMH87_001918 [Akanthomyces muscarius]KAJ4147397.1 hypothetical protein LMH87_001918 [Akanthomyces muscarius]
MADEMADEMAAEYSRDGCLLGQCHMICSGCPKREQVKVIDAVYFFQALLRPASSPFYLLEIIWPEDAVVRTKTKPSSGNCSTTTKQDTFLS